MNEKTHIAGAAGASKAMEKSHIALDDCRFHQCVSLSKFESDREITFVPPEGVFELMTYRITEHIDPPFKLLPTVRVVSRAKIEMALTVTSNFESDKNANSVVITLPCPKNTASVSVQTISN